MKELQLSRLSNPEGYLKELLPVYEALLIAAEKSNDLRQYVISSLMVKQLAQAKDMMLRSRGDPRCYCYNIKPFVYVVEDSDTVKDIMWFRDRYIYNPAMAM